MYNLQGVSSDYLSQLKEHLPLAQVLTQLNLSMLVNLLFFTVFGFSVFLRRGCMAKLLGILCNWVFLGMFILAIFGKLAWSTIGWSVMIAIPTLFILGYIEGFLSRH